MAARKKTQQTPTSPDPVTAYAQAVGAGKIIAGPHVRLACKRHLRDLATGHERGLVWDLEAANRVIGYFRDVLCLNGGEFEGMPFVLKPWEAFIAGSLFGWKAPDGTRRFRVAFVEVGKGNGKSPFAAGVGLYMMTADNEPRAEVYAAAVDKEQAQVMFRDAVAMVDQSKRLDAEITRSGGKGKEWNLAYHKSAAFFRPISSEHRGRGKSGPRPHCVLLDEVHEHPTGAMVEFMRAGTKGRRQALILEITNSGFDRDTVCWEHHQYSTRVLDGSIQNDAWFAFIASLDEADDPLNDESCWPKANPSLPELPSLKYLREQVAEARDMTGKRNIVLRLNFCQWTEQSTRWLHPEKWAACAGKETPEQLEIRCKGRKVFAGLDLSSTSDITALVLDVPIDGKHVWICRFWIPKENIRKRVEKDGIPFDTWVREGWVKATDGNVVDYDVVRADITELARHYNIAELAIDRWNATQISTQLMGDGLTVVQFGQGFASMSAPSKELEKLVLGERLVHGGHPVLNWMASNVAIEQDAAGNIKPAKHKSAGKIDGVVAGVMGLARATAAPADGIESWLAAPTPEFA